MSTPFACLLLAVIGVVVLLTLHFTSKTPPISEEPPRPVGALTSTYSTSLPAIEAGVARGDHD